ncbi:hypothetical protein [Parasphingorhabdus pacifica]
MHDLVDRAIDHVTSLATGEPVKPSLRPVHAVAGHAFQDRHPGHRFGSAEMAFSEPAGTRKPIR